MNLSGYLPRVFGYLRPYTTLAVAAVAATLDAMRRIARGEAA